MTTRTGPQCQTATNTLAPFRPGVDDPYLPDGTTHSGAVGLLEHALGKLVTELIADEQSILADH